MGLRTLGNLGGLRNLGGLGGLRTLGGLGHFGDPEALGCIV